MYIDIVTYINTICLMETIAKYDIIGHLISVTIKHRITQCFCFCSLPKVLPWLSMLAQGPCLVQKVVKYFQIQQNLLQNCSSLGLSAFPTWVLGQPWGQSLSQEIAEVVRISEVGPLDL